MIAIKMQLFNSHLWSFSKIKPFNHKWTFLLMVFFYPDISPQSQKMNFTYDVAKDVLDDLRKWVLDAKDAEPGFFLFEKNLDLNKIPRINEIVPECMGVPVGAGFYISCNVLPLQWHCDSEASIFGRSFYNVLIPLFGRPVGISLLPEDMDPGTFFIGKEGFSFFFFF